MRPLIGSIRKWKKRAAGQHAWPSVSDCPLCLTHRNESPHSVCGDCPIKGKTGQESCKGTPVEKYDDQRQKINGRIGGKFDMAARKSAQRMVDLMEGLL